MKDPYYGRSEVSNSDLSWLKNQLHPRDMPDPTNAYKFGTLIDCMLTEPHKVNYSLLQCDGEQYTSEEFETASEMRKAFLKDDFCRQLLEHSTPQMVMVKNQQFEVDGFKYMLPIRSKWDIWMQLFKWGADIKSTTAKTQKQFIDAIYHFDHDRQRAFYMTNGDSKQDMLIGISKYNFEIFKVPITRADGMFKSGMNKVNDLTFKWWQLFGELKPTG
ncbi:PD-(D/E)XK nuclease-like domain-containing protein [Geofilum rhodophaeum]|uniref:PD-(D/E)XK nuclease-like domain-containing protein n=1 Tax=Geofilum rhodophaeum TaxID=1965019 RepID=UPI000B520BB3|nr:hypothetical protein [Geofilum rhodophaeum]